MPVLRPSRSLALSRRDRRIIELALTRVRGSRVSFDDARRALEEAVREDIPSGRIFVLGYRDARPIIGSLVSGVGIVEADEGIRLVRVGANPISLGWFAS